MKFVIFTGLEILEYILLCMSTFDPLLTGSTFMENFLIFCIA